MAIGVSQVFHLNVNCTALDRSLGFYRDLLGLTQTTRTAPEAAQPGAAFGLAEAQWDAWILTGDRGYDGVVLDLLEWQVPPPGARAAAGANRLGFSRLGFTVPDVDEAHRRFTDAGVDCFGAPHDVEVEGVAGVRAFVCADPDGTLVELVSGGETRLSFVAVGCRDLDRSTEFYADVLGFRPLARFAIGPHDGGALRLGPDIAWDMGYLDDPRGELAFALDLVQWRNPDAEGDPPAHANEVGIYRLAMLTDDIDRDHDELRAVGVTCMSPPATLEMGPGIPPLRALIFLDPDGAALELIEPPT